MSLGAKRRYTKIGVTVLLTVALCLPAGVCTAIAVPAVGVGNAMPSTSASASISNSVTAKALAKKATTKYKKPVALKANAAKTINLNGGKSEKVKIVS